MNRRSVNALPALSRAVDEGCTDLLLMEEFDAAEEFCGWLMEQTAGEHWRGATVRDVGRSVGRFGRESDLEVGLRLLIDIKSAPPSTPERCC